MVASPVPRAHGVGARLEQHLTGAGYRAEHTGLAALSAAVKVVLHPFLGAPGKPPLAQRRALRQRFRALLDQDLANARAGYYPTRLLFRAGVRDALRVLPEGLVDMARVVARARRRGFHELPAAAAPERYPRYYRRNFHWQSDGWLSERSARLYDPGVELLFGGTGDIMRRMILPDLVDALRPLRAPRVLDVACGTGRFLGQLHEALPHARLHGLDLSPPYLDFARAHLAGRGGATFTAANAEAIPLPDAGFDAVTTIYLFHELPKDVRRNVLREIRRVLRPGGTFAVVASAQRRDAADILHFIEAFPRIYHEPYYTSFLADPLEDALAETGFDVVAMRPAFVSRVLVARRPGAP